MTRKSLFHSLDMARMLPESGVLGDAPWRSLCAPVPRLVELRGDRLYWKISPGRPPSYLTPAKRGMLGAFVRIRDGAGALRFAQRHGVLFICEHGVPASHNPGGGVYLGKDTSCKPTGWPARPYRDKAMGWPDGPWEPVESWVRYARLAKALLWIGAALHRGEQGDAEDWETVYQNLPDRNEAFAVDSHVKALFALSRALHCWLSLDPPTVRFQWLPGEREPEFQLRASTFGNLGLQLAASLLQVGDIVLCQNCGEVYEPRRKPRAGYDKRNFCPSCRDTVAPRLRQRDSRARQRQ